MIDHIRRNMLATGAAATAVAAAPQVFAQRVGGQRTTNFYERGPVRIAYQEVGQRGEVDEWPEGRDRWRFAATVRLNWFSA